VSAGALQAAYEEAAAAGTRVRGVLITNPSNPVGTTVERAVLEDILDFVARNGIHLISDEIYSGCVFASPDFVSMAELVAERGGDDGIAGRVHIVYSLSKDLAIPGFRVGVVYSYNDAVVAAARRMSSFTLVSSQTQRALAGMLSDSSFAARYIRANRDRLRERHDHVVAGLALAGVGCMRSNAGLFVWVDMRELLDNATVEGELRLWRRVMAETKLNVSPGSSFHCSEPGWFRMCFANMSLEILDVALRRMNCFMERWNLARQ
jgi:1-aminocyclopropane-1-carboxylate synthase